MKSEEWRLRKMLESPLPSNGLKGTGEVVVCGAGTRGREAGLHLKALGVKVRCFLDRKAASIGKIGGIPCIQIASAKTRELARRKIPAVLAVFNYQTDVEPLRRKLRVAGFDKIHTFGELHEILGLPPVFWLGKRKEVKKRKLDILKAFACMADEKSRITFCDHIGLRLGFEPGSLAFPDRRNQYSPADISGLNPKRLVDGGAFDGDTLRDLLKKNRRLESIAAFEPDLVNFRKLVKTVATRRKQIRNVSLFPAGLGKKTGRAEFTSGEGASSRLSKAGANSVPIVALDDVLPNFSPSLIKLDIEGSEEAALRGAQRLIFKCKPSLAVSAYHKPEDIWELPLTIKSMFPFYRIKMRCHGYNGFDLVLYASLK